MPMRNDQVVTVRRTDYRPPAFLLDRVELEFDLDPASTRVACDPRSASQPRPSRQQRPAGPRRRRPRTRVGGGRWHGTGALKLRVDRRGAAHPGAIRSLHRPDRQPHLPGGEHRADGPVRVERQLLQPVRGRGLPPHHVLPGSTRRDGTVPRDRARGRRPLSGAAVERQPGRAGPARRRPPLRGVGRPVRQAELPVRAGRRPLRRARGARRARQRPRSAAADLRRARQPRQDRPRDGEPEARDRVGRSAGSGWNSTSTAS